MYYSHVDSLNQVNNEFLFGGVVVEDEEMQNAKNKEMVILNSKEDEYDIYANNTDHLEYSISGDEEYIYLNLINLSSYPVTFYFGDDIEWEIISLDANKTEGEYYSNKSLYIPTANRIDVKIKNPKKSFVMYTTLDGQHNSEIGFKIN